MSSDIKWVTDLDGSNVAVAGGKAASLGELTAAGVNVPPAFVVTADSYRRFLQAAGIEDELMELVDVDVQEASSLTDASARAKELILEAAFPDALREEILTAYGELGDDADPPVAVRSSATAEDMPSASFAGQQETFLNVQGEALIDRLRECWSSLFTPRAIYYRSEQGFDSTAVNMAVVVQRMVQADVSGVLFTRHPSTGDERMVIEAAWGLGEAVVSGTVSPDTYVVDAETGEVLEVNVATKRTMMVRDTEHVETTEIEVPDDQRDARVLEDTRLETLRELGNRIQAHYGTPQDIEWAIEDGEIYVLQSRPITTMPDQGQENAAVADGSAEMEEAGDVLLSGIGASPGRVTGPVRIVHKLDQLDKVDDGDILVTEMTTPDMVPAMKRAAGIVTDEGGMTSHASIVSRELGVPAVVGTSTGTTVLEDGQRVTIDGERGVVFPGGQLPTDEEDGAGAASPTTTPKPMTATRVKVNVSIPDAAPRAAETGADGVGLLRIEHLVLSLGKTPSRYIADHGEKAYIDELVGGIRTVADAFYPRPVRVRTLDAPTDEFRQLIGGDDEPTEHNPMMGYRGIRRSLDRSDAFLAELGALRRIYEMGYDNVEIMLPLVTDASEIEDAKALMEEAGIDLDRRSWGVMIETPASALRAADLVETGIDFASFGTNDLTQYTLAVDRNNEQVAALFDELHPAVLQLIGDTIETCSANGVETGICGQAGSKPRMVKFLVEHGISSISANIDAVRSVQEEVKRVEQRLILDAVR